MPHPGASQQFLTSAIRPSRLERQLVAGSPSFWYFGDPIALSLLARVCA